MILRTPKLATKFLRWFCREDQIEEIEGDLIELFDSRALNQPRLAQWLFVWDVFKAFHWINMKSPKLLAPNSIMLGSYFKTGCRNLRRDFNYSLLNTVGLSLGLVVFIIMIMMVNNEYNFDQFHSKGDRIFEVIQEFENSDGADPEIYTSLKLAETLREELPIIENAVSVHSASSTWMEVDDNRFFEEEGIIAGPQFFEIFDFELKAGDKEKVLLEHNSIILDEDLASKFFGDASPLGRLIQIQRYGLFKVTGVLETVPSDSFIQFNFIISQDYDVFYTQVAPWFPEWFQSWEGDPTATFVLLNNPEEAAEFTSHVELILRNHTNEEKSLNPHYLINLYDLHFGLNGIDGRINRFVKGDKDQIQLFVWVAFLILAMACFNYVNISTARSVKRFKEVGVRKSLGAIKGQIKWQFLIESFLQVGLAFIFSVGLLLVALPYFNSISGINLEINSQGILALLPFLSITLILVSLIAGFYPAILLSNYSPIKVLRKANSSEKGNTILRNSILVVQFSLVIIMLTSLLIVNKQYQYLNRNNLGFDTDQLLIVEVNGAGVRNNYLNIKNELLTNPKITNVTGLTRMISGYRSAIGIKAISLNDPNDKLPMRFYGMDADGLKTLKMKLIAGSDFSGIAPKDSASIFLNETAAKRYGGNNVIGEWISFSDEEEETDFKAQVIGVIEDFNYQSLHEPIGPVVIGFYKNPFEGLDDIVVRVSSENVTETIAFIDDIHNKFDENDVMTWEFMNDMVQRSYEKEQVFRDVFVGSSLVSFVIAIMGIIGLISYNVVARTKELGIRKVLGASYIQLIQIHSKAFLPYLLIAVVLSAPVLWWLASQWLMSYAYRIDLSTTPFIVSFGIICLSTLTSVWLVVHKSANRNPVESIRYE